jgi:hypothetical protein
MVNEGPKGVDGLLEGEMIRVFVTVTVVLINIETDPV